MSERWLTILGIGEDGLDGLPASARARLGAATLVVGGVRHLALVEGSGHGERLAWPSPMGDAIPAILARRPDPVVVLASGDPSWFGVAAMLATHVPLVQTWCLPAPSAFSLACARLGWALQDCATISFCGRPVEALAPLMQPGARVLALSADATTPAAVASYLTARGFGQSRLHVLEALGGPRERIRVGVAACGTTETHALNMLAIEVVAGPDAKVIPLAAGLPDDLFEHDGQITKREVRAATLAALAPRRGELLWDVGCGSGSVGIEWMLRHPANRAIGIDKNPARAARAVRNAIELGVPGWHGVTGVAPEALRDLPSPDAVFVGGGLHEAGVLDTAFAALPAHGRLVANAITIESEAALLAAHARLGGTLTRLSVERLDRVGGLHGFRPAMTVTQFIAPRS